MDKQLIEPLELPAVYEPVRLDGNVVVFDAAVEMARQDSGEGTLVWATHQPDGVGRPGKNWYSPDEGLYAAVILEPEFAPEMAGQIGLIGLLSMGQAIAEDVAPMTDLAYRWPNDIILSGSKVGGIQLARDTQQGWLVLGVSVNVRNEPAQVIDGGCVCVEGGNPDLQPAALLRGFAREFLYWLNLWDESGLAPIRTLISARLGKEGGSVLLELPGEPAVAGVFSGLAEDGSLKVEIDGASRLISLNNFFGL